MTQKTLKSLKMFLYIFKHLYFLSKCNMILIRIIHPIYAYVKNSIKDFNHDGSIFIPRPFCNVP